MVFTKYLFINLRQIPYTIMLKHCIVDKTFHVQKFFECFASFLFLAHKMARL